MAKCQPIPMQILDCIITQSIVPVPRRLLDFNAISAVELIKLVSIANDEINRTPFGTGCSELQKYLYLTQLHTCNRRRITPGEAQSESQFAYVEVGGATHIGDRQGGMVLFTVDIRGGGLGQWTLLIQAARDLKELRLAAVFDAEVIVGQAGSHAAARR